MGKRSCGPEPAVYNCIVDTFKKTGSVREASERSGASGTTVQRVLITEGLWSSKTSKQVQKLLDQGMSANEIARKLNVVSVLPYMPYERKSQEKGEPEPVGKKKKNSASVTRAAADAHSGKAAGKTANTGRKKKKTDTGTEPNVVLKLHLELTGPFNDGAKENLGMGKARLREFLSLEKAEKGISRDILAPGDMTLHALHYAIQRLFGWTNCHRHFYSLPLVQFIQITGSRFSLYGELCGSLFRFPDGDLADQEWDDDYTGNSSFKSWLRKKYSAPFRHRGSVGDSFAGNRWAVADLKESFPELAENATFLDVLRTGEVSEDFNCLIQHRTLQELLLPEPAEKTDPASWLGGILEAGAVLDRQLQAPGAHLEYYRENARELREWRKDMAALEEDFWLDPDGVRKIIREKEDMSYEDYLQGHREMIRLYAGRCRKILYDWDFPVEPFFSEIYYQYEDTEDWCVRITVEERRVDEDAYKALNGRPVCVHADGIGLLDDCGGVSGCLDVLRTIFGPDCEEKEEMRKWAESMGWSEKVPNPAKIL